MVHGDDDADVEAAKEDLGDAPDDDRPGGVIVGIHVLGWAHYCIGTLGYSEDQLVDSQHVENNNERIPDSQPVEVAIRVENGKQKSHPVQRQNEEYCAPEQFQFVLALLPCLTI